MKTSLKPPGPSRVRSTLLRSSPNLLTSSRLALGFAFPLIPEGWRLAVLVVAALTEFLDGQMARSLGISSATGRILDPIADKVFVLSVLTTLLVEGELSPWQLALIASRDITVTAGALWVASRRGISSLGLMNPSPLGKLATAAQFLFLVSVVAAREVYPALLLIASVASAAAAIDYVRRFRCPTPARRA